MWALKTLHEKNWRESLHVQEFHHPQIFSEFLQPLPDFSLQRVSPFLQQRVFQFFLWFFFYLFLEFHWLDQHRVSPICQTVTGEMSLSNRPFRSRVFMSLTVGDEDELEEDVEQ